MPVGALPMRRVAVGLLWQETNSFNLVPTGAGEFACHEGAELIEAYQDSETSLGGIIRRLRELKLEPVPAFAARARPGGPIEDGTVGRLLDRMVETVCAAGADAICLELHGSMAGVSLDDVEGELLERLRSALGRDVPVAAALDLHGHVTARMMENADILTGYRTHPHSDMVETGARAVDLLVSVSAMRPRPVGVRRTVPMLALWRDETGEPGMRAVLGKLATERERRPGILDVSIFNTHPFLDLPGMGQVVLAYGPDADEATALADAVAAELWCQRDAFAGQAEELPAIFESILNGRAAAIGDQGDSVLAGAPGDSVEIARFASLHAPDARGLIPLLDPEAVAACAAQGVGREISLDIGGRFTPGLTPLPVRGMVTALTAGLFANAGAYMKGVVNDLGPTAVLRSGPRLFVLTTKGPSACDPALATHAGTSPDDLDYMVVKSSNHFRLSLAGQFDCRVAATPGLTSRRPDGLRHRRARPLYPIDTNRAFPEHEEKLP